MDFHQTEYQFFYEDHPYPKVKLHFKKSVFFFKNVLVCLGSNIKIDNGGTATKARTTLFQDKLARDASKFSIKMDGMTKDSSDLFEAVNPLSKNTKDGYTTLVDTKASATLHVGKTPKTSGDINKEEFYELESGDIEVEVNLSVDVNVKLSDEAFKVHGSPAGYQPRVEVKHLDQYENETNVLEAESGEEVEETSDVLEDKGKTRFRRGFVSYELMIFLGTGRHPSDYKDYGCHCRRRLRKGPRGGKRPRYRRLRVMGKVDNCCRIRNICLGKLTKSKYCPFKKIGAPFDIPYLAGLTKSGGKKIFKCASFKYRSYDRCRKELCKCNTEAVNCFVRNKYRQKYAEIKPKMCRSRG
ncbi:uncharacterized protein LOC113677612 [Pocillopora damicornis]|uniref:uncharacterized protein LOC113677612 n=1 Tax=Pocillopora damicornis TaxID=46731 RepID=UPI000F54D15D|nr:uncharacterized protein LOC113677612 [Pocillopora damicornis]